MMIDSLIYAVFDSLSIRVMVAPMGASLLQTPLGLGLHPLGILKPEKWGNMSFTLS